MPSYNKLPSGKWRGRAMIHGENYSVVADTKRECVRLLEQKARIRRGELTVGEAIEQHIEANEATFSPATVKGYLAYKRNYFRDLQDYTLSELNENLVAKAINEEARRHSPKTVRNAWGLVRVSIAPYVPVNDWRLHMPQKTKTEPYIPTEEEVRLLIEKVEGTKYELPFKLAAYCGLRRSEICALTYDDYKDGYLTVDKAVVSDKSNEFRTKQPKTYAGYRKIKVPKNIKIEGESGMPIVSVSPHALTQKCRKASGYKFSIHDLRHFYASMLLRLGIPDKYAAKQMGHSGEYMLQRVYQHLFADAESEYDALISDRLGKIT